jgi:hypothetical protein
VEVDATGLAASTSALPAAGGRRLVARVRAPRLLDGAAGLLGFVAAYLAESGARLQPGETLQYGYWSLRFVEEDGALVAFERDDEYSTYVPGVDRAVTAWETQRMACEELRSAFDPPRADAIAVAASDVFEAPRVEATRYEAGENHCGWWFLTDSYTGDASQVVPQHLHHLTAAYPQFTQYLALDVGWSVRLEDGRVSVYRDPE